MAESLPFHLLVSVFFAARDGNDDPDTFDHGGDLVHWDSMESAADFTLVSKAWLDAGVFALYRSISIIGEDAAELFLRTIRDRPERAASVRSLVIGLLNDEEDDAEAESNKLLEVLESCPLITSLQVRPLHPAVRHRLLSAIQSKRLTSLVCLPRIDNDQDTESVYRSTDLLKLVTPSLVRLEVDFWAKPDHLVLSTPCPLPSFPPLALVDFRSFSSGSDAVVLNILKMSGPTLENVIVYFENLFPDSKFVADALATSMGTLRTLTFVTNPIVAELDADYDPSSPQIFDSILPHFLRLEFLKISATEVSPNVFNILPPSLRRLEIDSLNHRPAFRVTPVVLLSLRNPQNDLYVTSFRMQDMAWEEADVGLMGAALGARRITFEFAAE